MPQTERSYTRYQSSSRSQRTRPPSRRAQRGGGGRAKRGGGRRGWRWLKIALFCVVVILVALCSLAAGTIFALSRNLHGFSHLQASATAQSTTIFDAHGKVLTVLHGPENRTVVRSAAIPTVMKEATVASEDQRFYAHHGIDFQGLARALIADIVAGHAVQGGSTITEQYVKNAYVGSERDVTRKLREAILAWQLEDRWTKDQILTAYLNTVYYGQGAYGVEVAAETYFHEHARQLTLPQAALLVAVAKPPSDYDPVYAPQVALRVRNAVLDRMAKQGFITAAQASAAKAASARSSPTRAARRAVRPPTSSTTSPRSWSNATATPRSTPAACACTRASTPRSRTTRSRS